MQQSAAAISVIVLAAIDAKLHAHSNIRPRFDLTSS